MSTWAEDDIRDQFIAPYPDDGREWIECDDCGGEGGRDGEELMQEDPLWYDIDDWEPCQTCHGKGGWYEPERQA